MLEIGSALVTLANLALALVIGLRLMRIAGPGAPERWLGAHFVFYQAVAALLSTSLYLGWSDPGLALPPLFERGVNAAFHLFSLLGMTGLLVFARRAFRPASVLAGRAVWLCVGAMAAGAIGLGVSEGFQVRVLNGPFYWLVWLAREGCFVWLAVEAVTYWHRMRRRLQIGLSDPLVTNRFALWGVWASAVSLLGLSDPVARLWYFLRAGTATHWVPEIGHPIVVWVVAFTSAFGMLAAVSLFLAFFPTEGYRRFVTARAPRADASP